MKKILTSLALLGLVVVGTGAIAAEEAHNAAAPTHFPINEPKEPLTITVNKEGAVYIQETTVPIENLVARLQGITGSNADAVLYVRGDKEINYGRVLEVMSLVTAAGFHKVSLVAESPKVNSGATARPRAAAAKR